MGSSIAWRPRTLSCVLHQLYSLWWCLRRRSSAAQGLSRNFTQILMAVIFASIGGSIRATLTVSLVSDLLPPHQVR